VAFGCLARNSGHGRASPVKRNETPVTACAKSSVLGCRNPITKSPNYGILNAMSSRFRTRLAKGPIVCDGAMGTLLYAKGVFINRCYDELNLSQPDLIRAIHHEYLQAGAEIVETNTFGANAFRLARHSIADKVRDINRAGAHVAREAAKSFDVWVAGSVGPLGTRIEPLGKTSFQEA